VGLIDGEGVGDAVGPKLFDGVGVGVAAVVEGEGVGVLERVGGGLVPRGVGDGDGGGEVAGGVLEGVGGGLVPTGVGDGVGGGDVAGGVLEGVGGGEVGGGVGELDGVGFRLTDGLGLGEGLLVIGENC
jgi:hypothetical protein